MTEYNLFFYAEKFNDMVSFQHKRYRIFNKEISKEEYNKITIPKIKLEFDKTLAYDTRYNSAWNIARNKLSNKEKKKFTDLIHFDVEIFEKITGIKVNEEVEKLTLEDVCKKL